MLSVRELIHLVFFVYLAAGKGIYECGTTDPCDGTCDKLFKFMVESRPRGFTGWAVRHPSLTQHYEKFGCKVCIEIGVARGELAYHLMKSVPSIEEYHAVDPFLGGYDTNDAMSQLLSSVNSSQAWKEAILRVQGEFGCKFRLHYGLSSAVAHHFPPNSVDCLFIDGDHTFEGVTRDLFWYAPSVRPGGYILFDDVSRQFPGVVKALDNLEKNNGLTVHQINRHNNYYVQKPLSNATLILDKP